MSLSSNDYIRELRRQQRHWLIMKVVAVAVIGLAVFVGMRAEQASSRGPVGRTVGGSLDGFPGR
ncbi:MAG TPA: hypothetical protein PKE26_08850 [Kiritimatiellia bacterium]|nr:hypothetical protein [Kiritimatiellia bacterium]HMO99204.1 hypothetical protein [Kiritimatiellia bacterium]HMP95791.1 hypothetical protein [Kiritimatiellia bacterium]